jgi:3-oxoacyl-[acyl-carrier-protein] synthase II
MSERRVVITGAGAISAAGVGRAAFRDAVRTGKSYIKPVTTFPTERSPIKIGGQVENFRSEDYFDRKIVARTPRNTHFAFLAADEAIAAAGLDLTQVDPTRVGSAMGTTIGGTEGAERGVTPFFNKGPRFVSPFLITTMLCNGAMSHVSIKHNLQGITQTVISEGSGGADAIRVGAALVTDGDLDVALVGGCEAILWRGFYLMLAGLAMYPQDQSDPATAYRPFDRMASGFVPGEGTGLLIIETEEHARARGATPLAEVAGYGATFDAADAIGFSSDGYWYAEAMRDALRMAGIEARDLDAVIADGRAVPAADRSEAAALTRVLEGARVPITCTKGVVGHAFSAAGGLDAIAALDMMCEGFIPPIANLNEVGVEGDLDFVMGGPRQADVRHVLLGARGLGGTNIGLVLRRLD